MGESFEAIISRGSEGIQKKHAWVLPGQGRQGQRFAIQWDGLIYPIYSVGKRVSLKEDIDEWLARPEVPRQLPHWLSIGPLGACFLLRLGEVDLAERVWTATLARGAHSTQYLEPARDWTWNLFDRAVRDHMRGDDRVALLRLRQLVALRQPVDDEADRLGVFSSYRDRDVARVQVGLGFLHRESIPLLLADQERRNRERHHAGSTLRSRERITETARRLAALVRDLEEVKIQARLLDNPGTPEIEKDPRVVALSAEGRRAVEPLITCFESDGRLTRSVAYWRFGTHAGKMVSVAEAAYAALSGIVGADFLRQVRATVDGPGPSDPDYRKRLAAAIRERWKQNERSRPVGETAEPAARVTLYRKDIRLRAAVRLIWGPEEGVVEPNVPDVPVTVNLRAVPTTVGLRLVVRQAALKVPGLTFGRNSIYFIRRRILRGSNGRTDTEPKDPITEARLDLRLRNVPLRDALQRLFAGSGVTTEVDPELAEVPVSLRARDTRRRIALYCILRQVTARVPNVFLASVKPCRIHIWRPPAGTTHP